MSPAVILRPWRSGDAASIAVMADDPHVRRWSSLPAGVEAWLAREQRGERGPSLAICAAGDERALGKVALRLPGRASPATTSAAMRPEDAPAGELSYWVIPEARGQGLALDGVRALLARVRPGGDLHPAGGLRSVVLDIEHDNAVSLHLADRLGAARRTPPRTEVDRLGVTRTLIVCVLTL